MVIKLLSWPKRVNKYKRNFNPRKTRECLYEKYKDLEASVEIFLSESGYDSNVPPGNPKEINLNFH